MSKRTADAEPPDSLGTGSTAPEQALFSDYPIDPRFYDEIFEAEAVPREHCRELWNVLDGMAPEEIAAMQERAERSFLQEGITFAVYGEAGAQERIIPIDVLPRIVDAGTWEFIERGLHQRLKALNLFLADGESTLDVKVTVVSEDETAPDWSPHREWPNLRTVAPTPREYSHRFDQ